MNLDGQFPGFMTVKDAIWPAYLAARERQGFMDPGDLMVSDRSMMDFNV